MSWPARQSPVTMDDVQELAEALRSARAEWDAATRDGAQACGLDVVAAAYTAMQTCWFQEIGVHLAILEGDRAG